MSQIYETLFERLDGVVRYDSYLMALCPFHEKRVGHPDTRASFMVHDDPPGSPHAYYCKSCGASGSLEYLDKMLGGLVQSTGHIGIREYPILPRWRKWIEKYGTIQGIAEAAHGFYCRNQDLRTFFYRRGIEQFYKLGMFGWLDWWNLFPVLDSHSNVIDIVVRADTGKGDTKYVLVKKSDEKTAPPIYVPDWELFKAHPVVYVVYGIIDSWAIRSLGLASVTGVTGKSLSAKLLYPYHKQWIIVPDAGEEKEAWELKMELGSNALVKELDYPFRTKDPDGIKARYGAGRLSQLLGA